MTDIPWLDSTIKVAVASMPVLYPAVLAFAAFIIRLSTQRRRFRFWAFVLDLATTIFVGFIAAFAVEIEVLSKKVRWVMVFFSALIGPELIAGVLQLAAIFSRSPVTFVMRIVRAIGGTPVQQEELTQMMEWERTLMEEIRNRHQPQSPSDNDPS